MRGGRAAAVVIVGILFSFFPAFFIVISRYQEFPAYGLALCYAVLVGCFAVIGYGIYAHFKRVVWSIVADEQKISWGRSDRSGVLREVSVSDLAGVDFSHGSEGIGSFLYFELRSGDRFQVPDTFPIGEFLDFVSATYPNVKGRRP